VRDVDGIALVTADHGNAEQMIDATGEPHTAHTTNPVPFVVTQPGATLRDDDVTIEYPTGSGANLPLSACADDLRRRLISLFLPDADGRRPCHGYVERMQSDPRWRDNITFNEYFHGDNGAGLGATHQTGWTGLVADLICRPNPLVVSSERWRAV
jgi:hypothetical protein